ncbi:endonuclease domain-containing protein [Parasphingorhabdus halotolerans]|nr:endonuclease domain-containing protein [Parasphingorhabdus halotolerans]
MRNNPTEPEKRLWRHLSNGQLNGHKFRRQSVIGYIIADFVCPQRKLIVEVDGDTHDEAKDRVRDDILGEHGYHVVRVTNQDVMGNLDGVLVFISGALRADDSPHPNPVSGKQSPGLFRSCRGHDRPETPEVEGLREVISLKRNTQ